MITISLAPEPNPFPTALMELYFIWKRYERSSKQGDTPIAVLRQKLFLRFYFCHVFPLPSLAVASSALAVIHVGRGYSPRTSLGRHPEPMVP
jgi:hypothetical protein